MGAIAFDQGDFTEAEERYHAALPLYRKAGAVRGAARCIRGFGEIALARGDFNSATAYLNEALTLYQQIGATRGEAACLFSLGEVALAQQDPETALERFQSAFDLFEQANDTTSSFRAFLGMAKLLDPAARATLLRDRAAGLVRNRSDLMDALRKEFPGEI
jgi:tetratricopeptide (TPR) repeat protein